MKQSIENTIKYRINGHGRGWCFTINHFVDLLNPDAVKKSLQRLHNKNLIRRLSDGLYDYPRMHPKLGLLPPDVNKIAKAISEKDEIRVQPSGAYAANVLGFSEQVPAKIVFVTEGRSKKIKIDKMEIVFRKTTPKNMMLAGTEIGLIIQGLKYIGIKYVSPNIEKNIQNRLNKIDSKQMTKAVKYAPEWIGKLFLTLSHKK